MQTGLRILVVALTASWSMGCAVEGMEDEAELDELYSFGSFAEPIIFVHGCTPPNLTDVDAAHLFDPLKQFAADEEHYPANYLVTFINNGPQCQSTHAFAQQLSTLVNQVRAATGEAKVDIVAHSMGALAARLYIAKYGGAAYVEDLVTIGGGDHGSVTAVQGVPLQQAFGYPAFEGMQEMYPPYACKGQTSGQPTADVQYDLNGCLTPSGRTVSRDETPGSVSYRAIWNDLDEIAVPAQTGCLNQTRQNDCGSSVNFRVSVPAGPCFMGVCPGHLNMLWDDVVMEEVLERTYDD